MPNIFNADNGVVSGSAGIKLSSDTSGVLNIQTNGTTAISISASQVVSFPATSGFSFAGQVTFAAGTAAAPSISVTGDTNTGIYFPGADQVAVSAGGVQRLLVDSVGTTLSTGVLTVPAGTVSAPSITTTGDSNTGIYFPAADTIAFTEGGVESMRIDASGNLAIGKTSTSYKLGIAVPASASNQSAFEATNQVNASCEIFLKNDVATINAGGTGNLAFANGAGVTERARIDSSGNLGLGVTPSAWSSGARALQVGNQVSLWEFSGGLYLTNNRCFATGNTNRYIVNGAASSYEQNGGVHTWLTSASGTAGGVLTSTTLMTLDTNGNLGIGIVTPGLSLDVERGTTTGFSGTGYRVARFHSTGAVNADRPGIILGYDSAGAGIIAADTQATGQPIAFWTYNGSAWGERARLTAAGELCIQRTTPTFNSNNRGNITIGGTDSSILFLGTGNGTGSYVFHEQSTAGMEVWNTANGYIRFGTNATERARITNGGALFVGTTSYESTGGASSGATAAGFGYFKSSRNTLYATCTDAANAYEPLGLIRSASTGNLVAFWYGYATQVGTITTNGTNTAYNTSSDRRLKDNIAPADDAASIIDAIEVVKHDWKSGGHTRYGVVAQDLHAIAPEAVSVGDPDSVEELKQPWGVDYSKLVPMLVKEIQSLRQRVAQLEVK